MGAVLKQIQEDENEKPIIFFQKNLLNHNLECIAINEAMKFWQYWLVGIPFTVYTDHQPLENLSFKVHIEEELGNLTAHHS